MVIDDEYQFAEMWYTEQIKMHTKDPDVFSRPSVTDRIAELKGFIVKQVCHV